MNEKDWTREFVAALWHNGGFESIAELHNRQLVEQLAFQMPLRAERSNDTETSAIFGWGEPSH